ncbi:hypothetical protein BDN70DRAFT_961650 [Pholiota conissans]|uniref:Uncharacterized protein n=1 Tax=Pholiota conissans TaxID=109636 RepID=A0A9P5Z9Z6_9AGAR|nr:hypothetical protein BDN70DRAFT_961650 [Pholiota conissans]
MPVDPSDSRHTAFSLGIMPRDLEQPISASISHKMKWAAKRQVTRDEDTAYSLMGLFGVSMSIAYGEGAGRAFSRLVNEILNGTHGFDGRIMDLFNFGEGTRNPYEDHISRLLPVNPQAYLDSSDYSFSTGPLIEPLTSTHLGLRIPVLVLPAAPGRPSAGKYTPLGDYFANPINYTIAHPDYMSNDTPTCLNILDISAKKVAFNWLGEDARCIVAVLNCSAAPEDGSVLIPSKCLADGYIHTNKTLWVNTTTKMDKIPTKHPITFELRKKMWPKYNEDFYTVAHKDLGRHGMQFLWMYL